MTPDGWNDRGAIAAKQTVATDGLGSRRVGGRRNGGSVRQRLHPAQKPPVIHLKWPAHSSHSRSLLNPLRRAGGSELR